MYDKLAAGRGLSILAWRRKLGSPRVNPLGVTPDEYEDALRSEGVTEGMIQAELETLKMIQRHRQEQCRELSSRKRPAREVRGELSPYVEAEIRRLAGVAADDVLQDFS